MNQDNEFEEGNLDESEENIDQQSKKGFLKTQVIDNGIGIAIENISKLFQPFVQAESSTFQ